MIYKKSTTLKNLTLLTIEQMKKERTSERRFCPEGLDKSWNESGSIFPLYTNSKDYKFMEIPRLEKCVWNSRGFRSFFMITLFSDFNDFLTKWP